MIGPFLNVITLGSPVCHFVNHFQILLADHYITLWSTAAVATFTMLKMNAVDVSKSSKNKKIEGDIWTGRILPELASS